VLRRGVAPAVLTELSGYFAALPHSRLSPNTRAEPERTAAQLPRGPLSGALAPAPETADAGEPTAVRPPDRPPTARTAAPASSGSAGPDPGAERRRWPTSWAGLLFLLATAGEAGVPVELLDDPVLVERPLWWGLRALATRLVPAAPSDPAVLVFAGLLPGENADDPEPSEEEAARLDLHAQRWALRTAERLDQPALDPFQAVTEVALRHGEIAAEPGWVDVHLGFDQVDVGIRRAGLDVDPGWVPWLGMVVRFIYE
jgi:hypothetical protein